MRAVLPFKYCFAAFYFVIELILQAAQLTTLLSRLIHTYKQLKYATVLLIAMNSWYEQRVLLAQPEEVAAALSSQERENLREAFRLKEQAKLAENDTATTATATATTRPRQQRAELPELFPQLARRRNLFPFQQQEEQQEEQGQQQQQQQGGLAGLIGLVDNVLEQFDTDDSTIVEDTAAPQLQQQQQHQQQQQLSSVPVVAQAQPMEEEEEEEDFSSSSSSSCCKLSVTEYANHHPYNRQSSSLSPTSRQPRQELPTRSFSARQA